MRAPDVAKSTREEREAYIKTAFACKGNCEICGLCATFHGQTAELVYEDYIEGTRDFLEITQNLRR